MLVDDEPIRGLRLPSTLVLPPSHTAAMVGHFLKGLYADILKDEHPRHLTSLIEKFDAAERARMNTDQR